MPIFSRIKKKFRSEKERPQPPAGSNNYVLLILDSCRYDSFVTSLIASASTLGVDRKKICICNLDCSITL